MSEPLRPDDETMLAHPDRVDEAAPATNRGRWARVVLIAVLGAVVVLVVVLHLTGVVGPGAH